ncbi:MAG: hypothetical protein K6G34_07215 [Lachnospiraceae bacterium]|nr:hypothetical protein [Lachnospiraceae bacterium]
MRGLKGSDLFTAMRIVRNAGVQEEIQKLSQEIAAGKKMNQSQVGAQMIIACVCGCANPKAEAEIWNFLGDLTEKPANELKDMDLEDLMKVIEELTEHISKYDFKNFFKQLSRLISAK